MNFEYLIILIDIVTKTKFVSIFDLQEWQRVGAHAQTHQNICQQDAGDPLG